MSRESRIADAVMRVDGYDDKSGEELADVIAALTQRVNSRLWWRDDLVAEFGEQVVAVATHKLGPFFATYLVDGIDMSVPARRARFAVGGDLRAVIGAETADLLLGLGLTESSPWLDGGNDDDPPTAEECEAALAGIVNQRLHEQRVIANYNAAREFIAAHPAATWSEVAALLTE